MAQADSSLTVAPLILPRPVAGHRRQVQLTHPGIGAFNLLTTDSSWGENPTPNYVVYAATPAFGPKQRAIHSQGVKEITWGLNGELTNGSMNLAGFLDSRMRGLNLNTLFINQGPFDTYSFSNLTGASLPWASFTLSGSPGGAVTFSLEGRSTQPPLFFGGGLGLDFPDVPVPSWYTGNDYVLSWTLSHSVSLTPVWRNNPNSLPAYYRPGPSEYKIQVSTSVVLREHTVIRFGLGFVALVEAVVTSRNRVLGDANTPAKYEVTSDNARVSDQSAFIPATTISLVGGPNTAGFS